LRLSPREFYDLTPAEYADLCQGFFDWEKSKERQQESIALWQAVAIAGLMSQTKEHPFNAEVFWKERQESKKPKKAQEPEDETELLIIRAKMKGIKTPEKWR
jgi:hypothetical protein